MFEIDADTGRVTTRIPLNLGSYPLQIEVSDVSTCLVGMRNTYTQWFVVCQYMYIVLHVDLGNFIIFSNCKMHGCLFVLHGAINTTTRIV